VTTDPQNNNRPADEAPANETELTAYLLGELDGSRCEAFEAALRESPELRDELEATRQVVEMLQGELSAEPCPKLSPGQHRELAEAIENRSVKPTAHTGRRSRRLLIAMEIAAMLLLCVGGGYWLVTGQSRSNGAKEVALRYESLRFMAQQETNGADRKGPPAEPNSVARGKALNTVGTNVLGVDSGSPTDGDDPLMMMVQPRIIISEEEESAILGKRLATDSYNLSGDIDLSFSQDAFGETVDLSQMGAEKVIVPFDDNTPIAYPSLERWQWPTKNRTKFALVDLGEQKEERLAVRGEELSRLVEILLERQQAQGNEQYVGTTDNPFAVITDKDTALSTFSIDVDTASYTNMRRFLTQGQLPPRDAVRIEELINYFDYDYPQPEGDRPFSTNVELADCPWNGSHQLLRIGLMGRKIIETERPATNLVFLLDVSGSMGAQNKLPLVQRSMRLLVESLTETDRVAIVVYAGAAGLVLPSTPGSDKEKILASIDQLKSGGSTAGASGIQLAYQVAMDNFNEKGANRVILATDGDFNVGVSEDSELEKLILDQATSGVFLSVLGFGMGNIKDAKLEMLADKGNGTYAYVDSFAEAERVFKHQLTGTLYTIAKDVKIQVEFNPAKVKSHRLIGYANRIMPHQDFRDDSKDAGEIGSGHTVTALYEIVPVAGSDAKKDGEEQAKDPAPEKEIVSRYQGVTLTDKAILDELGMLKLRYKKPDGHESALIEQVIGSKSKAYGEATIDFKFASAVASFGMLLRDSEYKGDAQYAATLELASEAFGPDELGQRHEFVSLVKLAKELAEK